MPTSSSRPTPRRDDREPELVRPDDLVVLPAEDVRVVEVRVGPGSDGPVQRVTSARGSHTEDVARRMRNYAISMGIRTLCVVVAVLTFPHWYAWLFVPGAVLLPYVAVVLANAGRERAPVAPSGVTPAPTNLPVLRSGHQPG